MMNFEDQSNGWDVIFRGLISPFANRFKKYIQQELKDEIADRRDTIPIIENKFGRDAYIKPSSYLICTP